VTYIQMTPEEFHQRADAVLQRAQQCMSEYDREKLKVAEWQAGHLRECEITYSDKFLAEVCSYEANYAEDHREKFRLACNYYRSEATTPTSSETFQRLSFRAPVTTIAHPMPTTCV
jgi:hypothetical protein